jgi:hypothetical protein
VELRRNLRARMPVDAHQDDARAAHDPVRRGVAARPAHERRPIGGTNGQAYARR